MAVNVTALITVEVVQKRNGGDAFILQTIVLDRILTEDRLRIAVF